jgi:hypothetical protein
LASLDSHDDEAARDELSEVCARCIGGNPPSSASSPAGRSPPSSSAHSIAARAGSPMSAATLATPGSAERDISRFLDIVPSIILHRRFTRE